jgi:large subunit ribosomal protein L17
MKNLASSLLLTERDAEFDDNAPQVKGRIVTTMAKAKEVRPLIERCITIARNTLNEQREADSLASDAERDSEEWKKWRASDRWVEWNQAIAPVLSARRRTIQLLGNKEAVSILFDDVAPRFEDRPGGYTRIMRLAKPRLGDAGIQVILELVGERDRVKGPTSEAPRFEDENPALSESAPEEEEIHDQASEGEESENLVEADDMDADENEKSANNS